MAVLDIFMFYTTTKTHTSKPWSYVPGLRSDYSVVVMGDVFPNADTPWQTANGFSFSAACLKRQANTCLRSAAWTLNVIKRCIESKSRQQKKNSPLYGASTPLTQTSQGSDREGTQTCMRSGWQHLHALLDKEMESSGDMVLTLYCRLRIHYPLFYREQRVCHPETFSVKHSWICVCHSSII